MSAQLTKVAVVDYILAQYVGKTGRTYCASCATPEMDRCTVGGMASTWQYDKRNGEPQDFHNRNHRVDAIRREIGYDYCRDFPDLEWCCSCGKHLADSIEEIRGTATVEHVTCKIF